MGKLVTAAQATWAFGARDGFLRLEYELSRSSGLMSRRMRAVQGWEKWSLERIAPNTPSDELLNTLRGANRPFFFSGCQQLAPELKKIVGPDGERAAQAEACGVLEGTLPFFGRPQTTGSFPPNWFRNPMTGGTVDPERSWTQMRFASNDYGDLKFILEPSRFLFVYPLARGYALSGEERFAEAFWASVEDWARKSPPMSGPLWVCGQESSLRILAWSFGLYAFLHSRGTTPQRVALLLSMITTHAWRTEQTLGYARSQRSNHLVSEAVGLWTAGTLFPELKHAMHWQRLGAALLKESVLDQITPEGVHLQYSFHYQRMVLHLLLWALRLAQVRGVDLDPEITARAAAAFDLLGAFVDAESGCVPNYGSNDGTNLLPLSACDNGDFRPFMQLGARVLGRTSSLESGPWDETALWMCGQTPAREGVKKPAVPSHSGYYRLGSPHSWAMVRAGRYRRRPFQADQLHVDLWWHGLNVACDAGTYLYNGPSPWDNGLAGTAVHNTVTVDDRDQMRRAGRFLWLDWAQASGRVTRTGDSECPDRFEGEHDGYQRIGVTHRRTVQSVCEDAWVITDDLVGSGEHTTRLHWLSPDWPCEVVSDSPLSAILSTPQVRFHWNFYCSSVASGRVIRAGKVLTGGPANDVSTLGWRSPTYGELCPALSLVVSARPILPVRFVTVVFAGDEWKLKQDRDMLMVDCAELHHEVSLAPGKSVV